MNLKHLIPTKLESLMFKSCEKKSQPILYKIITTRNIIRKIRSQKYYVKDFQIHTFRVYGLGLGFGKTINNP